MSRRVEKKRKSPAQHPEKNRNREVHTPDSPTSSKCVPYRSHRRGKKDANYHIPRLEIEKTQQSDHTNNWYSSSWEAIPMESSPQATSCQQSYVEANLRLQVMAKTIELTSKEIVRSEIIHAKVGSKFVGAILSRPSARDCYFSAQNRGWRQPEH